MKAGDLVITQSGHKALVTEILGEYAWFWYLPDFENGMNIRDFSFRKTSCIKKVIESVE